MISHKILNIGLPQFCLQFDMLELDRFAKPLVHCPLLLDFAGYLPDTFDLTEDEEARNYWLNCFEEATEKVSSICFLFLYMIT